MKINGYEFDERQIYEIGMGIYNHVDISYYADKKFNADQMLAIRLGLQDGLDVSKYADPSISCGDMEIKRKQLKVNKKG